MSDKPIMPRCVSIRKLKSLCEKNKIKLSKFVEK